MRIEFTVPGKPMAKLKMTGKQHWTPKARKYVAYKNHVQECIQPALIAAAIDLRERDPKKIMKGGRYLKPIAKNGKMSMQIFCHFEDETHPDPENVFGAIADAIFVNDKHLASKGWDFACGTPESKVEVTIEIPE